MNGLAMGMGRPRRRHDANFPGKRRVVKGGRWALRKRDRSNNMMIIQSIRKWP